MHELSQFHYVKASSSDVKKLQVLLTRLAVSSELDLANPVL